MTDPRKRKFEPYVRLLADRMRLKDWEITLEDGPSSEGSSADVRLVGPYRRATVRLSEEFLGDPPEVQRRVIVHELAHLLTARLANFADEELDGPALREFVRCYEHGVEEVAMTLAPMLPLPETDAEPDGDDKCSPPTSTPSTSRSIADIFLRPFSRTRSSARLSPGCRSRPASTASGASGAAGPPRPSAPTR